MKPTVIFDLGNVILPFDPLKPCRLLARQVGKSAEEVCELIYNNDLERAFEAGEIEGHQFTQAAGKLLGLSLDEDRFRQLWADMFVENGDVSAIVRDVRRHCPLMLLSNTNRWHWEHARKNYSVLSEFDSAVLSFEVGVLKPDPRIFQTALDLVEPGGQAVFIDDIPANIEAARQMGMTGIDFHCAEQLRTDLRRLGCLTG